MTRVFWYPRSDENGSVLVRALLAHAVREIYGIALPRIEKDPCGKPFFPDRPDIHFSISHTKTCVLCAVGDSPLGADTETVRTISDRVKTRVCSQGELMQFDFFELWTLKESFFKLFGRYDGPFRSMCFRRSGDRILSPASGVFAVTLSGIPGCRAAVCSFSSLSDGITAEKVPFLPQDS